MGANLGLLISAAAVLALPWMIAASVRYLRGGPVADAERLRLSHENARLASENEELAGVMRALEERLQVLERIATDPAARTAQAIEELR